MSEVVHTPGPWYVGEQVYGEKTNIRGNCLTIGMAGPCGAVIVSLGASRSEQEANAKLIAAAPALLHTVRDLIGCADPHRDRKEIRAAREVLFLATGSRH